MPSPIRVVLLATALAGVALPQRLGAQASPYIRLDDPRLPLLEYLIARGEVEDPSPMLRPFRRRDAVRVLAAADSASTLSLIQRLRREFGDSAGNVWSLAGRGGLQGYTHARRELLHPSGTSGISP